MKPAQVLGISGSPRRNGNSELLIREFMRGAEAGGHKTKLVILSELKISPCTSCGSCQKTGKCIIDDDMQLMHKKLLEGGLHSFCFSNLLLWSQRPIEIIY